MGRFALPCVVCGKPLLNCDEGSDNQPYGGTEFVTRGHYGSTIIDVVVEDEQYEFVVNICDTCILRAIDSGVIQSQTDKIVLSNHPIPDGERAWVLAQNEKWYGSAWGKDEPVDYRALMLEAGWSQDQLDTEIK